VCARSSWFGDGYRIRNQAGFVSTRNWLSQGNRGREPAGNSHGQFTIVSRPSPYFRGCELPAEHGFRMEAGDMKPYIGAITRQAFKNENFRQVIFTGMHEQLVLMCLKPGEEIGNEMHAAVDQFFLIEEGEALFVFGDKERHQLHAGEAVVVPAGTAHNVSNPSRTRALKLYTLYSQPQHPAGTVQKTKPAMATAGHR
jgi:mannose-6-phosphate isomerase-like protein (cupin superfamily)